MIVLRRALLLRWSVLRMVVWFGGRLRRRWAQCQQQSKSRRADQPDAPSRADRWGHG